MLNISVAELQYFAAKGTVNTDKNKKNADTQASVKAVDEAPEDSFDYVNKYGTYEIQPTCGIQDDAPYIAQGNAKPPQNEKKHPKNQN